MLRSRLIPVLLLRGKSFVKTVNFKKFSYIGDPCNTVRIFNELEVDEISILDIMATRLNQEPNYDLISDIASEAFMPLSYGGGIKTINHAKKIFDLGIEKIILNSEAINRPEVISEISEIYGSQAVTVSIDVKQSFFSQKQKIYTKCGTQSTNLDLVEWALKCQSMGAGEIMLNAIDRDGTWSGYDINLFRNLSMQLSIPLIGIGGAKNIDSARDLIINTQCSAAGVGSMVVFQKEGHGVLINYPEPSVINAKLHNKFDED